MALGTAIYSKLRGNATILSTFADRIFPIALPQNTDLPAITYQQTGLSQNDTKSNFSNVWNERQVQIVVFTTTAATVELYCDLIETAMVRNLETAGSETFKKIQLTDVSWEFNPDFTLQGDQKGIGIYLGIMNFNIVTT
jgi:hypothetical protein